MAPSALDPFDLLLRDVAAAPVLVREPNLTGATLGRFELHEKLGEGGMGVVYRARDPKLERDVAIKVLSARLSHDDAWRARLADEAKSLAQLSHPHIARVFELGDDDGAVFLVMELVERTLHDAAQSATWDATTRDAKLRELAQALSYAHGRGVVHRDIKPDNLGLDRDGALKVLDFGLARLAADEVGGTPGFMPPEQARGDDDSPRVDVYAFGKTAQSLGARGRLLKRCVSDDPAQRPANGAALVAALKPRSPVPVAALVATLVVLAIVGIWYGLLREQPTPALLNVPVPAADQATRARFRAAVQALYAADLDAAKRTVAELPKGPHVGALELVLGALTRDAAQYQRASAALAGVDEPYIKLLVKHAARGDVDALEGHGRESGAALAAQTEAFLTSSAPYYERLLVAGMRMEARVEGLALLIEEDPRPALPYWLIANVHQRTRDEAAALAIVRAGRAHAPKNRMLTYMEASMTLDTQAGRDMLDKLIDDSPGDLGPRFARAEMWFDNGDTALVVRELERFLDRGNGFAREMALRGVLAFGVQLTARGESAVVEPLQARAMDELIDSGRYDAALHWLPTLYDDAELRQDTKAMARWRGVAQKHTQLAPFLALLDDGVLFARADLPAKRLQARRALPVSRDAYLQVAGDFHVLASDEELLARADACVKRTLFWEHICRVHIARAAHNKRDFETLRRVWPNADPGQAWMLSAP